MDAEEEGDSSGSHRAPQSLAWGQQRKRWERFHGDCSWGIYSLATDENRREASRVRRQRRHDARGADRGEFKGEGAAVGMGISVVALFLLLLLFVWYRRHLRQSRDKLSKSSDVYRSLDSRSSIATLSTRDLSLRGLIVACKEIPASDLVDIGIIGGGGSGVVYLVQDMGDEGRRVLASKRLHRDQHSTKQVDAFVADVNLAAQLSHPRVVEFVGIAGLHKTELQALFEYMPGGDLRKYLDLQPPRDSKWTREKLQIAVDVAVALVYLHSLEPRAVVHRDLKSRNIKLTRDHRAKVCDFGIARSQSADASMTTGVGTSRWLAPEVILGGGDYDAACDVYSFGVVLTELDTHRVPFSDLVYPNGDQLTDFAVLEMIETEQKTPSLSETCPASIAELTRSCLTYEATRRPTAHEVAVTLRSIQRDMGWESSV